jgi:cytochrome c oxidase subunit 3
MIVIVLFMVVMAGFAGWWLLRQGLATKPWLEVGMPAMPMRPAQRLGPSPRSVSAFPGRRRLPVRAARQRLFHAHGHGRLARCRCRLRAVVQHGPADPEQHRAATTCSPPRARRARRHTVWPARGRSVLAGVSRRPGAGLAGAAAAGYFAAANPAGSFFYLVTAIHGLHMLGGLVALAAPLRKPSPWMGSTPQAVSALRLSVELCATYWHFLLLVWLVLFSL